MLQLSNIPVVEQIKQRRKLIAITQYNSIDYFLYRGEPAGYQYELLKAFAKHLDVELEIIVRNNQEEAIHLLNRGQADLIAGDLLPSRVDTSRVDFTLPVGKSRLVVVQRPNEKSTGETVIKGLEDLSGQTVNVADDREEVSRMELATASLAIPPVFVQIKGYSAAEVIKKVADEDFGYTVCDEKSAITMASLYRNLNTSLPVSRYQTTHWGIRKGANAWGTIIDEWLGGYMTTKAAAGLYRKYFDKDNLRRAAASNSTQSAQLSDYDQILRKTTHKLGWDWRLVAALIYQESKFSHEAVSHKGAAGIMQLMPATANEYGVDSTSTPAQHIVAGLGLLMNIDNQLKPIITDSTERLNFVLASYNVGIGHILDARRLAIKHGDNPDTWSSVAPFLLKKSQPVYYTDDVVYYGFCHGDEPTNFVRNIMKRYKHYRNLVEE